MHHTVETLEQIKARIEAVIPVAKLEIIANDSPSAQRSLLLDNENAVAVARFLREDPELRFDYLSNMSGVDWPDLTTTEKVKTREMIDGVEREIERTVEHKRPGYLEAVYHLYSMQTPARTADPANAHPGSCRGKPGSVTNSGLAGR